MGSPEAFGHRHLAGLEVDPLAVAGGIGGQDLLDTEVPRRVDDHVAGLAVQVPVAVASEKGFDVKLLDGDCDWPVVMKALREIGYKGWGTAEIRGGGRKRLAEIAERMDRIFADY